MAPQATTAKSLQQADLNKGLDLTTAEFTPRVLTHVKSVQCFTERALHGFVINFVIGKTDIRKDKGQRAWTVVRYATL